jgi:hypothetical protein
MITGAHFLLYSTSPEADRAFLGDVLELPFADIGEGWLIFALPAAEMAVHPSEDAFVQGHADVKMLGTVLYLMCDDVRATIVSLAAKGVTCGPVTEAEWGIATSIPLPSGGSIGLYQPTHPTALGMWRAGAGR